ncbi:hypothetical protein N7447_009323 [Penicillium robsamsonii]|uniref:uncharacterized protein n=1 Tax=Penicillium robsamsonii TaxID=1792511 RepID=UPI0025490AED|nr:uncharacterized protein N7447_009323 [Penicillium robsamsonii]KAJ5817090.1 hypothetical protein N7447_009323 [Penicillium robsamsonii]
MAVVGAATSTTGTSPQYSAGALIGLGKHQSLTLKKGSWRARGVSVGVLEKRNCHGVHICDTVPDSEDSALFQAMVARVDLAKQLSNERRILFDFSCRRRLLIWS